jgi:hypothetical protein
MCDTHSAADARIRINDSNLIDCNSFHGADISTVPASDTIVFIYFRHEWRGNHGLGVELVKANKQGTAIITAIADETIYVDGVNQTISICLLQ